MRGWYFHCPLHHFVLNVSTLPRPFPWPKELTGKSIFNFTWGKSFALRRTGVPSSYHDWHNNSRRGSPWPPHDHERPVPACPDRLMTWRIILLLTTVAVYCINSTIWTLTRWTLDTSTGTAEPPTTFLVSAQQYLFSIYLYYLHLGFGLPGQCQVGCLVAALWEKMVRPAAPGVSCAVAGVCMRWIFVFCCKIVTLGV